MSTIHSVPEARNAQRPDGVPASSSPLADLIEAAGALAGRNIRDISGFEATDQGLAECMECGRRRRSDRFEHASNCLVGRVLQAIDFTRRGTTPLTPGLAALPPGSDGDRGPEQHPGPAPLIDETQVADGPKLDGAFFRSAAREYDAADPERRVVCGSEYPYRAEGHDPTTCDQEVGHDADPDSSHWNRESGFSWPTAAKIAEELAAADCKALLVDVLP